MAKKPILTESSFALCRRIFKTYIYPHKKRILFAFLFMIIAAITTGATAKLMEPIVNDIFLNKQKDLLFPIAFTVFFIFVIKGFSIYGESIAMSYIGQRLITDLQKDLFKTLLYADLSYYHKHPSGELISRCVNDVGIMRQLVHFILTAAGKYILTIIALVGVMFWQDWVLASVSFIVFPLAILPISRIGKRMRKISGNTQKEVASLTSQLSQVFLGTRVVKSYTMENYELGRLSTLAEKIMNLSYKGTRIRSWASPMMETLGGLAIVIVIVYGGLQVMNGDRTPGGLFSFLTALLLAYDPMKRIATLNANLQEGLAAAERVFHMIDIEPKIKDTPNAKIMLPIDKSISFQNVTFKYNTDSLTVLKNISITLKKGKTYAFVGGSGAGKSTLLNLLLRFYDTIEGKILFDDQDIKKVTLESLRKNTALVSQDIILFDDTVEANILYGRPSASQKEVLEAAKAAAAHTFIKELPKGYDTIVGEQGVLLSGGQRQRIAIARAILKDAPILLLDEATSALDNKSERLVQKALEKLQEGRTCLIVAHRLSTVQNADCLFVLENGKIIEEGTHTHLLKKKGVYAKYHAMQFQENEEVT